MTLFTMPITALTDAFAPINSQLFPIKDNERRWLAPVHGAVSSLWLASLVKASMWDMADRLKVVVTRDQNQLNQIETELAFCGVDAYVFPDWETLTYDELSPHQDIVSERINLLTDMPTSGVLLISIQALMHRVAPPSWLIGQHLIRALVISSISTLSASCLQRRVTVRLRMSLSLGSLRYAAVLLISLLWGSPFRCG